MHCWVGNGVSRPSASISKPVIILLYLLSCNVGWSPIKISCHTRHTCHVGQHRIHISRAVNHITPTIMSIKVSAPPGQLHERIYASQTLSTHRHRNIPATITRQKQGQTHSPHVTPLRAERQAKSPSGLQKSQHISSVQLAQAHLRKLVAPAMRNKHIHNRCI